MILKILFGAAALLLILYNVYVQQQKINALKRENEEILNDAAVVSKKYLDLKETADKAEVAIDAAIQTILTLRKNLDEYKKTCFRIGCHSLI